MREMLRLASMEMRSENTNGISIFFTLFNEVLEQGSGLKGYKFNLRCFMCEEGDANYRAVREVYGEEFCRDRVRGCQFHFKQQVPKRKHQIPEENRDQFIQICNQLCLVARYEILKGKLEEMARRTPSLWSWIDWWDIRRAHIFGTFHHGSLPGCNLSEQGNKSWKPTGTMRVVHAGHDDTITMMFQEMQVKLFEENLHKVIGKARSQEVRDSQDRAQQIGTAQYFYYIKNDPFAILLQTKEALFPASHIPKSRSSFKPPPAKKQRKPNQPKAKKEYTKY